MNVTFTRVDYAQVGITSNGCLRIIHVENDQKKNKKVKPCDKIVVGGQNGVLLCMERKSGDTIISFKTPPGPAINCVRMGGALQTIQDKTFIASRTIVKGFSRKGKQFLNFESNMTEGICSMYVYGVDMFLCGRNSMYHFHDCIEKNSFFCADQINDILCLPVTEGGWVGRGITPVLASNDKTIKVVEGSRLVYEVKLNEIVNVLHLFMNDGGYNKQKVLYGTRNGNVGLVDLSPTEGIICFEIDTKSSSVISAIHFSRILEANGSPDLVIGKEDGLVELYAVDEADTLTFKQLYQCDESITGLECGCVSSAENNEIIVCTYSGWVFALTTRSSFGDYQRDSSTISGTSTSKTDDSARHPQIEVKVQQLRNEVEELENRVRIERDRYQTHVLSQQTRTDYESNVARLGSITNIPPFTINDKFSLRKDLACYTLSVELAIPIDYVLLQSDVKIDLMDVERNSAVVSITQTDASSGNALLAVYRCQADITRIEMRIRSIEGQFGTLRIYVVPRFVPIMCQMRSYPIKPLALHERIHDFDVSTRPLNTLTFTGSFSVAEAHSWLVLCTSQIPERCPSEENITFNFQSTFNGGTILQAHYSKGNAVYRSDNLSTIVILRDVISKIVTMRQLKVHISCDVNNDSIIHTLRLIHPKMEYQTSLTKKLELAKGLKELEATFQDVSYLSPELKDILANYQKLHTDVTEKAVYFDRILGIITDLYIDKYKVSGQNVKHRANALLTLLNDDYSFENLVDFFNSKYTKQ